MRTVLHVCIYDMSDIRYFICHIDNLRISYCWPTNTSIDTKNILDIDFLISYQHCRVFYLLVLSKSQEKFLSGYTLPIRCYVYCSVFCVQQATSDVTLKTFSVTLIC